MSSSTWAIAGAAFLASAWLVVAQEEVNLSLRGFRLVTASGLTAKLGPRPAMAREAGVKVAFTKNDQQRRLLALEARPHGDQAGAKTLLLSYRLDLAPGQQPRFAVVVFDADGGSWFKVGAEPLETGAPAEARLPVAALKETAFSDDESGKLEWEHIVRVWVGLVLEGPAQGSFSISEARFTDEPYRPSRPLRITGDGPGEWTVGKDPAVQATLTTPNEGPGGKPCMKFEFRFPGGRHMWATPSTPMPGADLEGYRALRLTYKAALPEGIAGVLLMIGEANGSQYFADPPPPPAAEWRTITIPLDRFKLGSWSEDDNEQLDLPQAARVFVGVHGTASGQGGPGVIWAADVELVP